MSTINDVRDRASAALDAGDHETALSLARLIRRRFPLDYQTNRLIGRACLGTQSIQEALDAFTAVLDVEPEDVVSRSAVAMIAEEHGDLETALEHFQRAFDVEPGNREIAREISRVRTSLNHPSPAEISVSAHSMARRAMADRKYARAIPWLEEARTLSPGFGEVAAALARAHWLAGRLRDAEEAAAAALAEHPNSLRALVVAAGVARARESESTLKYLARAAELNPGNAMARALFAEAGLQFPSIDERLEFSDHEIAEALSGVVMDVEPVDSELGSGSTGADLDLEPASDVADLEPEPSSSGADLEEDTGAQAEPADAEAIETTPTGIGSGSVFLADAGVDDETAGTVEEEEAAELPGESSLDIEAGEADTVQEPVVADRVAAAASLAKLGLIDLALAEYRAAIQMDPSSATEIAESLLVLAGKHSGNVRVRWLTGDALAASGQYRRAFEQYQEVLKGEGRGPGSWILGAE